MKRHSLQYGWYFCQSCHINYIPFEINNGHKQLHLHTTEHHKVGISIHHYQRSILSLGNHRSIHTTESIMQRWKFSTKSHKNQKLQNSHLHAPRAPHISSSHDLSLISLYYDLLLSKTWKSVRQPNSFTWRRKTTQHHLGCFTTCHNSLSIAYAGRGIYVLIATNKCEFDLSMRSLGLGVGSKMGNILAKRSDRTYCEHSWKGAKSRKQRLREIKKKKNLIKDIQISHILSSFQRD